MDPFCWPGRGSGSFDSPGKQSPRDALRRHHVPKDDIKATEFPPTVFGRAENDMAYFAMRFGHPSCDNIENAIRLLD